MLPKCMVTVLSCRFDTKEEDIIILNSIQVQSQGGGSFLKKQTTTQMSPIGHCTCTCIPPHSQHLPCTPSSQPKRCTSPTCYTIRCHIPNATPTCLQPLDTYWDIAHWTFWTIPRSIKIVYYLWIYESGQAHHSENRYKWVGRMVAAGRASSFLEAVSLHFFTIFSSAVSRFLYFPAKKNSMILSMQDHGQDKFAVYIAAELHTILVHDHLAMILSMILSLGP